MKAFGFEVEGWGPVGMTLALFCGAGGLLLVLFMPGVVADALSRLMH